jgi:hypothetical protein
LEKKIKEKNKENLKEKEGRCKERKKYRSHRRKMKDKKEME